jgi:hypothetical protein
VRDQICQEQAHGYRLCAKALRQIYRFCSRDDRVVPPMQQEYRRRWGR